MKQLCVRKLLETTQRLEAALLLKQPGLAWSFFCINLQNCDFATPSPQKAHLLGDNRPGHQLVN